MQAAAPILYLVFILSGFAALTYQVAWQRALFTIYGSDSMSVSIIVSAFMVGLGVGSLLGGVVSRKFPEHRIHAFAGCEFLIGLFGVNSLWIFDTVGTLTTGGSLFQTGVFSFLLVVIPTSLMGATLPLLVAWFVERTQHVGHAVGRLYSVNTLGSAAACFAVAVVLMRHLGLSGVVSLAAALNFLAAAITMWRFRAVDGAEVDAEPQVTQ